jgi:hypothetical protein
MPDYFYNLFQGLVGRDGNPGDLALLKNLNAAIFINAFL